MKDEQALVLAYQLGNIFAFVGCAAISVFFSILYTRLAKPSYRRLVFLFSLFFSITAIIAFLDIIALWRAYYWVISIIKITRGLLVIVLMFEVYSIQAEIKIYFHNLKEQLREAMHNLNEYKNEKSR